MKPEPHPILTGLYASVAATRIRLINTRHLRQGSRLSRVLLVFTISVMVFAEQAAGYGHAPDQSGAIQQQVIPVGIVDFQDETGASQGARLERQIAPILRQKLLTDYKDVLPRSIGAEPSTGPLTIEQMVFLGKQYGVRFIIRGGLLAVTTENRGTEMLTTVQLYATILSVEDSKTTNVRGEGTATQKGATPGSAQLKSADAAGSSEFKNSSVGLALASAAGQLATAIYQTVTGTSTDASLSNPQPKNPSGADALNSDPAKAAAGDSTAADASNADGDADLQQLIAQAEQVISSGSGSTESLNALSQALAGLKSALAQKANLLQQNNQEDAAKLDDQIATRREELRAAVSKITEDASNSNSLPTTPQQSDPQRKSLLASISEVMGDALNIIQKIQEIRAASRGAGQDSAGLSNSQTAASQQADGTVGTQPTDPTTSSSKQTDLDRSAQGKDGRTGQQIGDGSSQQTNDSSRAGSEQPVQSPDTTEVTGVVTDNGKPVAGATVTEPVSGLTTTTAGDGSYTLAGIATGKLARLQVAKSGKQIAAGQILIAKGRATVADFPVGKSTISASVAAIRMAPSVVLLNSDKNGKTGVVSGVVQDAQGKPAAHALVSLGSLAVARTDSAGKYEFHNVPEGSHQVTVHQGGSKPQIAQVQVAAAKTVITKIQVTPADKIKGSTSKNVTTAAGPGIGPGASALLRGRVFDDERRGVPGARVYATQLTAAVSVTTDENGNYEIKQLKPGSCMVVVNKAGYEDAAQIVPLRASEIAQHDFLLKKKTLPVERVTAREGISRCSIVGQVRASDGSPILNAAVELRVAGKTSSVARVLTNSKGDYTINAPEGRYELKASQKSLLEASRTITLQPGTPLRQDFVLRPERVAAESHTAVGNSRDKQPPNNTIVVRTGRISGRIANAKTGALIPSATISVDGQKSVTADREGTYSFSNLPPGSYRVRVKATGFVDQDRTITLRAGESASADFKLTSKTTIMKR
jgi:protocatechuate 3,4-dioxygenase beta subunit